MLLCICAVIEFAVASSLLLSSRYRSRSRGDNTFGSVRVCMCVCVRLSVGALLFEPFDFDLDFWHEVDLDIG